MTQIVQRSAPHRGSVRHAVSDAHLSVSASNLRPELYYAAINGDHRLLDAAIARGASLTWADLGKGRTALWVASYYGEDE